MKTSMFLSARLTSIVESAKVLVLRPSRRHWVTSSFTPFECHSANSRTGRRQHASHSGAASSILLVQLFPFKHIIA